MTKPLTHALPYLVGMLVGKWLTASLSERVSARRAPAAVAAATTKSSPSSGLNSVHLAGSGVVGSSGRSLTTLLCALATMVALAEVFLPYKWNNSHLPTRFLASLYAALFRFAWSLVLAYIIMSCRHRRGRRCAKPVNDQTAGARELIGASAPLTSKCASCHSLDEIISGARIVGGSSSSKLYDDNISMLSAAAVRVGGKQQQSAKAAAGASDSRSGALANEPEWCVCGSGGNLVNRLLSLDVFTYLSKLSFVAYLIHLPLMSVFIAQTRGLFAFSHTLVIHLALSYLVMTFLLSFLLVHIIELPFLTFEHYLFDRLLLRAKSAAPSARSPADGAGGYIAEPRAGNRFYSQYSSSSSYTINSVATSGSTLVSVSEKL